MREKRPDKRKLQGAETKKKLYEVAERLFSEHDFASVNVEDITDAAGITKGGFYVHYESKDALIALLISNYAARADADYKAFISQLPPDMPTNEVLSSLSEKISTHLENAIGCHNMKKVYHIMLSGSLNTDSVKGHNRELYKLYYKILERGIQRGEIRSILPLEQLSRHWVVALRGITYEWCVRYPDFDLQEHLFAHTQLLLNGITCK